MDEPTNGSPEDIAKRLQGDLQVAAVYADGYRSDLAPVDLRDWCDHVAKTSKPLLFALRYAFVPFVPILYPEEGRSDTYRLPPKQVHEKSED
jgi:hypothetical protein